MFNPLFWHLMPLLGDESIRYIFIEGGSSASKTWTICQALAIDMFQHEYSAMVFRRQQVDITDSIYRTFQSVYSSLELKEHHYFQQHLIKSTDDKYRIRFKGLDDPENIKGIESYNVIYNNEWSQFLEEHFDQQRKRLRGRKNQKLICDWNPISSNLWPYKKWIDLDKWTDLPLDMQGIKYSGFDPEYSFKRINQSGNSVWIKTTYRDNRWVVGHPSGTGGFVDEHTLAAFEHDRLFKPNQYRIYANGERGIMRTGGEFWKQFNEIKHVKPLKYRTGSPLHIAIDENVNPYVTLLCWQLQGKQLQQVNELLCKTPDNNAPKAAKVLIKWLASIGYEDVVFIYGDPSARRRSTVDENSRSFYDVFIHTLQQAGYTVRNVVGKAAPSVAISAAFINDIYQFEYDGYSIVIGDHCKDSIDDYVTVQEDMEGNMAKPKVKGENKVQYEPHGHISDAKRYFITQILSTVFMKYRNKTRYQLIAG